MGEEKGGRESSFLSFFFLEELFISSSLFSLFLVKGSIFCCLKIGKGKEKKKVHCKINQMYYINVFCEIALQALIFG